MKRTRSINLASMVKSRPAFVLAPLFLAVLAGCSEDTSQMVTTFPSNVDTCDGMASREKVTACEVAYYKALNTAEKERPRFTTMEECAQLYGRCEKPSDGSSFLVPALTGYVIASMMHDLGDSFRDRGRYYQDEYRRRDYSFNAPVVIGSNTGYANSNNSYKSAPPKAAPPPKPKPAKPASSGGFGSTSSAKKSWGGGGSSFGG